VQPINHFAVQAPTVQVAAEDVTKRINDKDPALPPAALDKTDNTIVTLIQIKQLKIPMTLPS
jgi:hypothetical protein